MASQLASLQEENQGNATVENPKSSPDSGDIMDISKLALMWDNLSLVRQRFRDGHNLVVHYDSKLKQISSKAVEKTTVNAKMNSVVLGPVCDLTRRLGSLPNIDKLAAEVKRVFTLNKAIINDATAYDQGWAIRHLIQVVKGSVKGRHITNENSGERVKVYSWPKDTSTPNMINYRFGCCCCWWL